jgi:hypothetical protein
MATISMNAEAKDTVGDMVEDKALAEVLAPYIEMGASAATIEAVEVKFKMARQKIKRFEKPGFFGEDKDGEIDFPAESKESREGPRPPDVLSHHVTQLVGTPGWYIHVTVDEGGRHQAYTSILQGLRFETEEEASKPENLQDFLNQLTPPKPTDEKNERWSYHMLRFSEGISNHYAKNVQQAQKLYADSIKKVCIIGTGILGTNIIAELCFQGIDIHVFDRDLSKLGQVKGIVEARLKRLRYGMWKDEQVKAALDRIIPVAKVEQALDGADLIIEATPEDLDDKQNLLEMFEKHCKPDTIMATTSLKLELDDIAQYMRRPERMLGMRFLAPGMHFVDYFSLLVLTPASPPPLFVHFHLLLKSCLSTMSRYKFLQAPRTKHGGV